MQTPFEKALEHWYQTHARVLPWRENDEPYRVYVSEILLQQTRVETVKEAYVSFLSRFPDIEALASADLEEVLKSWEGLGYYSRAKNLHRSAKIIAEEHGGIIPNGKQALLALPGIGEYVASAILSIAYHQKEIAVDGNLLRIYARLAASPIDPSKQASKQLCRAYFLERLEESDPSVFNQALMDIGELVCLPSAKPLCSCCPFASFCLAHAQGKETDYPVPAKKTEKKEIRLTVFLVSYQGRLWIRKREEPGLLSQMYELPNVEKDLSPCEARDYLLQQGLEIRDFSYLEEKEHVFSHRIWKMKVYEAELSKIGPGLFANGKDRRDSYPLPTAFSKLLKKD